MITETQAAKLSELRERVAERVSGKRLSHTFAVERECAALAGIFCPEQEYELRAAGLLHDITKQLSLEKQLQLCDKFGIIYTSGDRLMPKVFHAQTAVEIIRREFADFASEAVCSAVMYHTTGQADMSLTEKLLYLADYIEDTRTFEDCVRLREFFYERIEKALRQTDSTEADAIKRAVLRDTLILSFDMTIRGLIEDGAPIHRDTLEARNYLIEEREFEK